MTKGEIREKLTDIPDEDIKDIRIKVLKATLFFLPDDEWNEKAPKWMSKMVKNFLKGYERKDN